MKGPIVMVIHDAVYVKAPEEEARMARNILERTMEAAVKMSIVPLEVDVECAESSGERR